MTRIIGFEFTEVKTVSSTREISLRITYIREANGQPLAGLQHLNISLGDTPEHRDILDKLNALLSSMQPYVDSVAESEAQKLSMQLQGFRGLGNLVTEMRRPKPEA